MTIPKKNHNTRGNTAKQKPKENEHPTDIQIKNKNVSEQFVINEVEQAKANILDSVNATLKTALEEIAYRENTNIENKLKTRIEELEYNFGKLKDEVDLSNKEKLFSRSQHIRPTTKIS